MHDRIAQCRQRAGQRLAHRNDVVAFVLRAPLFRLLVSFVGLPVRLPSVRVIDENRAVVLLRCGRMTVISKAGDSVAVGAGFSVGAAVSAASGTPSVKSNDASPAARPNSSAAHTSPAIIRRSAFMSSTAFHPSLDCMRHKCQLCPSVQAVRQFFHLQIRLQRAVDCQREQVRQPRHQLVDVARRNHEVAR